MPIALLYEHPTWSIDLIGRAADRGIDLVPVDVASFDFRLPTEDRTIDLWVNRVNAMPSAQRPSSIVAATAHLLTALELSGAPVINGSRTHRIGGSKAAQASLFAGLGLATPASVGIYRAVDAAAAADSLGYPVLTKPNIGGSGNGIVRYDSAPELATAIEAGEVDLGIDGTGVVQRVVESADGLIHRIEMLGDSLFYGTEQPLQSDAFNYCAADGCAVEPGGGRIALFVPPADVVETAARIMRAADAHVGGVEYIIDRETGEPCFFDFNPYSNFIAGYDDELGFDPLDRYLDFILSHR